MEFPEYHFIAIGGIGQSALAEILLKEGKKVSGSDISKSKYVKKLENLGAKIYIGHGADNIQGAPKIVISSAIKEDNPELKYAREKGLEVLHRSDLLKVISQRYSEFFGFCGTHGKTTTSGLCAYLLSKGGFKPAYAIGGIIPELNTNGDCEDKNTPYFVAELDESDGTVVKYAPKYVLINNLEADHLDFYKNGLDDILKTFRKFILNLRTDSRVVVNIDNAGNQKLLEENSDYANFVTCSILSKNADYSAQNIVLDVLSSSFDFYKGDKCLGKIELSIPGKHNVSNALGVAACLIEAGFDFNAFAQYFKTFSGMGRRFQKSAEFDTIRVIDDYAHHPSEIKATLDAVKNYDKGRVVAIFQPHRFSRFSGFYNEFLDALMLADYICVLDVYAAGETYSGGLKPSDFAFELQRAGKNAKYFCGSIEEAAEQIIGTIEPYDLIFTLGAGDITKMGGVLNELYMLKK